VNVEHPFKKHFLILRITVTTNLIQVTALHKGDEQGSNQQIFELEINFT